MADGGGRDALQIVLLDFFGENEVGMRQGRQYDG